MSKKRQWSIVTYQQIETWRKVNNLSKTRCAQLFGVTNGTYHNWARRRSVATICTQTRIKETISKPYKNDHPPKNNISDRTVSIIIAYLSANKVPLAQLSKVIETIKESIGE